MTKTERLHNLARLRVLGDLMLDAKLSVLHAATAARTASLDRLSDLDRPAIPSDLPDLAAAEVALRYQHWADQRRAEINLSLARQTADWIEARQDAAHAFGKSQALKGLSDRLK